MDDDYYNSLRSYADSSSTVSYSEHFSDKNLKRLRTIGVVIFYITSWMCRPIRPFRIIWNLATGRQESRAEMGLYNVLRRNKLKAEKPA